MKLKLSQWIKDMPAAGPKLISMGSGPRLYLKRRIEKLSDARRNPAFLTASKKAYMKID